MPYTNKDNIENLIFDNSENIINKNNFLIVGKFEKVSFEQFKKDVEQLIGCSYNDDIEEIYNDIKLPKRSTVDSAGYDFFSPFTFTPNRHGGIIIPTGIRCKIKRGWALKLYPRSGQGYRYGMHLYDTVGIIDGDYYNTSNEGHITVKISVKEAGAFKMNKGIAICQGVFEQFGVTIDDDATGVRIGGFGSTDKK